MYPKNYQELSRDARITHWTGVLFLGMRWAGEDGYEEASIFDSKLIADLRAFDADIDSLFGNVLSKLSQMWLENEEAFLAKINAQMGTSFSPQE